MHLHAAAPLYHGKNQEATIVTARVPGARKQSFSSAVFSTVFSTAAAQLLGSVCSLGVTVEWAPSGIWPCRDFGEMIILVFLCSIFSSKATRNVPISASQSALTGMYNQSINANKDHALL